MQARADAAIVDASTTSHSLRLMGRRAGCSVKVCQLAKKIEAVIYVFAREMLQAVCD
jgi:hypothetical protein